jgi:hypothetical protein
MVSSCRSEPYIRCASSLLWSQLRCATSARWYAKGRFREDLYYRLSGATLTLPPVRERSDRDRLIEIAFDRAVAEAGTSPRQLDKETRRTLADYRWPGNMRELQHVARFAVAISDASVLDSNCLPPSLGKSGTTSYALAETGSDREAIAGALSQTDWNISAAAVRLGVSRAQRCIAAFAICGLKGRRAQGSECVTATADCRSDILGRADLPLQPLDIAQDARLASDLLKPL